MYMYYPTVTLRMGFLRVATFVVFLTGNIYCSFPPENFRYNCFYDICSFPTQYCDLQDQRCHYCNDDVCRSGKVPEQCQYRCKGLHTSTSSTSPTTENSEVSPKSSGQSSSSCPDQAYNLKELVLCIAIVAIVALILVVCIIVYLVCCKYKCLDDGILTKRTKRSSDNQEVKVPLLQNPLVNMEAGNMHNNGNNPQQLTQTHIVNMEAGSRHNNDNNLQQQSSKNGNGSPTDNKVYHPSSSDSGSEGKHSNINADVEMLNFEGPSSNGAEGQSYTAQNQHSDGGRHNNINDNNLLDSNLAKKSFDKNINPISSPTDAGKVQQIKMKNCDILGEHYNADSGLSLSESTDSLTILKEREQEAATAET